LSDVRFWHKADISRLSFNVRFWGFAVGGGDEGWEGGTGGGIAPVVWAMTDVDATIAITLAIAAARKLSVMAAPR
jgi:hypothetical protein